LSFIARKNKNLVVDQQVKTVEARDQLGLLAGAQGRAEGCLDCGARPNEPRGARVPSSVPAASTKKKKRKKKKKGKRKDETIKSTASPCLSKKEI
jgi:hypothetical protein